MAKRKKIIKQWCNACEKFRYRYWNMACTTALARSKSSGVPLRIYECPAVFKGQGFHITKKEKTYVSAAE